MYEDNKVMAELRLYKPQCTIIFHLRPLPEDTIQPYNALPTG